MQVMICMIGNNTIEVIIDMRLGVINRMLCGGVCRWGSCWGWDDSW